MFFHLFQALNELFVSSEPQIKNNNKINNIIINKLQAKNPHQNNQQQKHLECSSAVLRRKSQRNISLLSAPDGLTYDLRLH